MNKLLALSLAVMLSFVPVNAEEMMIETAFASRHQITRTTATLEKMKTINYFEDSTTGLTNTQYTPKEINNLIADYGKFEGCKGMPVEEYRAAMEYEWKNATVYDKKLVKVKVDLTKAYKYSDIVAMLKKLSRYEGVYLYEIGTTLQGRTMYALEIDVPSDKEKNTVILTGGVHARETAGPTYLLKEIADLLSANTAESREVLATTRFACVPCVNPDGREGVCFDTANYTYKDGQYWKAASNGVDINRNFPGLGTSFTLNGNKKNWALSSTAEGIYYPGEYCGCNPETQALMKFLYHYIAIEQAQILIDYHQQGGISYAGKPWATKAQQAACKDLSNSMLAVLNKDNSSKYTWAGEVDGYGLDGTGSTLTDYACAIAYGAKFSPGYGFYVYTDGKDEYPLVVIPRAEKSKVTLTETTPGFRTMTFEIGEGRKYLGYSQNTRNLIAQEYETRHFDRVLYEVSKYAKTIK